MSGENGEKCPHTGAYFAFTFNKKNRPAGGEELMCFVCNSKFRRFPDQKSLDYAAKFEKENPDHGCYVYFHD